MLREVKNGALVRQRLTLLGWRWCFARGERPAGPAWSTRRVRAIEAAQRERPVALVRDGRRCTWLFEGRFYQEDEGLCERDVLALVRERERRARRTLARAHATLARDAGNGLAAPGRERIPADVRRVVFERDGGRCVECGSDFDLQYDHVIAHSLGGASTVANLQVLCAGCNQLKGASFG
jgi:5-methylcytosine-specific restriction endonuclease McrA